MPGLINQTNNITLQQLNDLVNITSPEQFLIKVNHVVYQGWLYFILLWVLWVILFMVSQKVRDQPLNNAMYSGAVVTVASFILRGITMVIDGVRQGLLTDHHLWVFPIITTILAVIVWSIKD